jgi:hypothetical protein
VKNVKNVKKLTECAFPMCKNILCRQQAQFCQQGGSVDEKEWQASKEWDSLVKVPP